MHRDLHCGNVLISLKRGVQPGLELIIDNIANVCVCDLGSGCDTHGDKPNIKRSNYVGVEHIRAPEMWLSRRERPQYDTPVDIWAAGALFVQMIRGNNFFTSIGTASAFLKFWESVIGPIDQRLAKTLDWACCSKPSAHVGFKQLMPLNGLYPVHEHMDILKWDPASRISAQSLARRFATQAQRKEHGPGRRFRSGLLAPKEPARSNPALVAERSAAIKDPTQPVCSQLDVI